MQKDNLFQDILDFFNRGYSFEENMRAVRRATQWDWARCRKSVREVLDTLPRGTRPNNNQRPSSAQKNWMNNG